MAPITVLIADDHAIFAEGLRLLLAQDAGIQVVAEATDGLQALTLAEALQPDILLLDVQMPGVGGLEVLPKLQQTCPQTKVLILSGFPQEEFVAEALREGASGYLEKTLTHKHLLKAIHSTYAGELWAERRVLTEVLKTLRQKAAALNAPLPETRATLTAQERQVVECMSQGKTTKDIAIQLRIDENTVESHLKRIFGKLTTKSRFQWIADHMGQPLTWATDGGANDSKGKGL